MKFLGSCHCGNVAFEVEGEIESLLDCNCSICIRKGALLWFVARSQVQLRTPRENMTTYTFNTKVIEHCFCSTCGCAAIGFGQDPAGNEMAAINARCLENINLSDFKVIQYDGRSV